MKISHYHFRNSNTTQITSQDENTNIVYCNKGTETAYLVSKRHVGSLSAHVRKAICIKHVK